MSDSGRWRTRIVPARSSERRALAAFLAGFALEAGSEAYQLATDAPAAPVFAIGYYLSLAGTLLGFYFFWRGSFEWARLPSHPDPPHRRPAWAGGALLLGGIAAVAAWSFVARPAGPAGTPAPFAWMVGGVFAWAVGTFFLALRDRSAPWAKGALGAMGWAAFAGSFAIAVISGWLLGRVFFGLVVAFFTNWAMLVDSLGPFIVVVSPLFVPFALIAAVYAAGLRRASARVETLRRRRFLTEDSEEPIGPGF